MRKLRPREAHDPPKVTQRTAVRSNECGAMEHALALRGSPLTSCGPLHEPLTLMGPRPRVRQKPRRRAPREDAESLRDGPAFLRPSFKPGPPHPIPRLSCRISSAWWRRRGRKAVTWCWTGAATRGGPMAFSHSTSAGHVALRAALRSAQAHSALYACAAADRPA